MQTVSELYSEMWRSAAVSREHKAVIAGVEHGEDDIVGAPVVSRSLFADNTPGVGGCVAGQLDLTVIPKGDIPQMAEVRMYTRLAVEKYTARAVSYGSPLPAACSVVTPDGQKHYFSVTYMESVEFGSMSHHVLLHWSPTDGLSGSMGGSYRVDAAGAAVNWEEPIYFTREPPNCETTEFTTLDAWKNAGAQYSEWLPKGVLYIGTRKLDEESGTLRLHCFDRLMIDHDPFLQEGDVGEWPRSAPVVVAQICELMGVELDERTELDETVMVPYPNDWTSREILSMVATAHCGNWTMTDAGKLRLVPLWSIPEATHYLVDQYGDPITLGGVKILVE